MDIFCMCLSGRCGCFSVGCAQKWSCWATEGCKCSVLVEAKAVFRLHQLPQGLGSLPCGVFSFLLIVELHFPHLHRHLLVSATTAACRYHPTVPSLPVARCLSFVSYTTCVPLKRARQAELTLPPLTPLSASFFPSHLLFPFVSLFVYLPLSCPHSNRVFCPTPHPISLLH